MTLTADGTSYKLPTSLSVSGGVYTRTSDTLGTLVITPTSNVSFTVSGEEVSSGETWVINDSPDITTTFSYTINFTSNNNSYTQITIRSSSVIDNHLDYYDNTTYNTVYSRYGWSLGVAYRTVTFETAPTGDLLTWLQSNAVKQ